MSADLFRRLRLKNTDVAGRRFVYEAFSFEEIEKLKKAGELLNLTPAAFIAYTGLAVAKDMLATPGEYGLPFKKAVKDV